MAYIGRDTDKISNVEVLDNITFDGSSSYTLQKGGSNFTPSSANTLLVSINGVVQAGNFTVSGSTIDFGTAVAGTSTCDFILHYGVGLITTPADGTVTTAKLADSSVSLAKLTATGTKDATTFLRGDNTFAAPTDNGKVLQVIHGSSSTAVTSSSGTEVSTGVTAQITASSSSSKILIFGSINGVQVGAATSTGGNWKLRRHDTSTPAPSGDNIQTIVAFGGFDNAASDHQYSLSFTHFDTTSNTNARNYTITFNRSTGSGSVQVQNNGSKSSIVLMEIAG